MKDKTIPHAKCQHCLLIKREVDFAPGVKICKRCAAEIPA